MARYILTVIANAVEGREDEANDWYDNIHLEEVLTVPGFITAQRFEPMDVPEGEKVRYLAHYEIEADDHMAPMGALNEAVQTRLNMSDAFDGATATVTVYRARTEKLGS